MSYIVNNGQEVNWLATLLIDEWSGGISIRPILVRVFENQTNC